MIINHIFKVMGLLVYQAMTVRREQEEPMMNMNCMAKPGMKE